MNRWLWEESTKWRGLVNGEQCCHQTHPLYKCMSMGSKKEEFAMDDPNFMSSRKGCICLGIFAVSRKWKAFFSSRSCSKGSLFSSSTSAISPLCLRPLASTMRAKLRSGWTRTSPCIGQQKQASERRSQKWWWWTIWSGWSRKRWNNTRTIKCCTQ